MGAKSSAKLLQPFRNLKRRQEVAAICYRIRKCEIEFLLVQTRGGRWIFPKGGVEPGLSHAQSAALEAFEEAGVHGRIEEIPFARFSRNPGDLDQPQPGIAAHLCEVSRLERPQESKRKPTWFSTEKAKKSLFKDREAAFGAELVRVLDRAVSRIARLGNGASDHTHVDASQKDDLLTVHFEAFAAGRLPEYPVAARTRHFLQQHAFRITAAMEVSAPRVKIRPQVLSLGSGTQVAPEASSKVTSIDSRARTLPSKPTKRAQNTTSRSNS